MHLLENSLPDRRPNGPWTTSRLSQRDKRTSRSPSDQLEPDRTKSPHHAKRRRSPKLIFSRLDRDKGRRQSRRRDSPLRSLMDGSRLSSYDEQAWHRTVDSDLDVRDVGGEVCPCGPLIGVFARCLFGPPSLQIARLCMIDATHAGQLNRERDSHIAAGAERFAPAGRTALWVLLSSACYYLSTRIAWELCFPDSKVCLFFPPHAVLVSVLLLVPTRHWWAYTLAAIGAHFVATQQAQWPPLYALHCEVFDAAQNLAVAAGIRAFIKSPFKLLTLRDAIVFVLIAVISFAIFIVFPVASPRPNDLGTNP